MSGDLLDLIERAPSQSSQTVAGEGYAEKEGAGEHDRAAAGEGPVVGTIESTQGSEG